jgi:riboflavin kinase/FMN adenylyltransferase
MKPIAVVQGVVMPGKRIGRTLGVPTANLPFPADRPQNGVYVARVLLPDDNNRAEEAVLSQGYHPTVPEGAPTVEVFLLNRQENLYDRPITVEYLHYIRPEIKFESREAMRQQMLRDIQFSRDWFRDHTNVKR